MILDMMILLMIIIIFIGFAVAAKMGDKKELKRRQEQESEIKKLHKETSEASKTICTLRLENHRYQEDNEKLGYLINDLCKTYDIPIEDFKKFREKYNI